jgi:hypothetical protein
MDNTIQLEINDKMIDEEINSNSQKNIKLNKTDLEVLEKNTYFFLPELLKEPEKIKQKHVQQRSQTNSKPQINRMPNILQNRSIIQPMSQIHGKGMRGIGMRMF